MPPLGERVRAWRRSGTVEQFRGRSIHLHPPAHGPGPAGEDGPLLLLLHGFPSSSYDFVPLLGELDDLESGGVAALSFDFLGFGLSEKPRDHVYSLLWQADLVEELVDRHGAGRAVMVVAHDMGTSVATELLARDIEGRLRFDCRAALLFNGSIVLESASLTWAQKLLRSPLGPLAARLTSEPLFRRQFSNLFSERHPITDAELDEQWALICAEGGRTLGSRLVHYLTERVELAPRWHGAIREWHGGLRFAWGMEDPVATPRVLDALRDLRPASPVSELRGVGHYPQLEAPGRLADAVRAGVEPLL